MSTQRRSRAHDAGGLGLSEDQADPHPLGAAIATARRARELSQDALARQCRVTRSWLARIENGHRTPSFALLERIGAALAIDPLGLGAAALAPGERALRARLRRIGHDARQLNKTTKKRS